MTRRHHCLFGRLALVAMLLLASVPTLGRLAARPAGASVHASHGAMAAMPGMARAHAGTHATPVQPTHPAHRHDVDCAYCALLGATVLPVVSAPVLSPSRLPDATPRPWRAPPQSALPPGALGSRGPPART